MRKSSPQTQEHKDNISKAKTGVDRVYRHCRVCDAIFTSMPCYVNNGRGLYCSKKCRGKDPAYRKKQSDSYRGHATGSKHYNWKGGITTVGKMERVKFFQKVQPMVLARDNYTCQICDQHSGYLQVDHIKSWSNHPELRFELSNCQTLCMACHYYITFKRKIPEGIVWGHNLSRRIVS